MTEKKRDLKKAGKLAMAETLRMTTIAAGFAFVGRGVPLVPWEITLAVYLAGVVVAHFWVFKGMAGNPPPTWRDIHLYGRDSGIGIVVFLWPLVLLFVAAPEAIDHRIRKKFGILPEPEERNA